MSCSQDTRNQSKKCQTSGGANNTDLIINLPECLISHILSCLSTKYAVRTGVLSKAWKYKWTSIYNIKIEDKWFLSQESSDNKATIKRKKRIDEPRFINFVDRILQLSLNIRSFHLFCFTIYDVSRMKTWIASVFRHNVESVKLYVTVSSHAPDQVVLSASLLNSSTLLEELELELLCTLKVSEKICFSNLTRLYIADVQFLNDNTDIDTMAFTFPLLETLELRWCRWLNTRFVEFYAPALRSFTSDIKDDVEVDDYIIKILGASLAKFGSWGSYLENFLLLGSTVHHATLLNDESQTEIVVELGMQVRRLLKEFSCLTELTVTCYVAQAVGETKSGLRLPKYDKLERLELKGFIYSGDQYVANIDALFELLHAAPVLEFLVIDMDTFYMEPEDDYDYDAVESMPLCLVYHLKKVELSLLENKAHHFNLVQFLLKNGVQLKEFSLSCCRMDKDELRQKLSGFPVASTCLKFVITENVLSHLLST